MLNGLGTEQAAVVHFGEQRLRAPLESLRFPPLVHHQPGERAVRQQAGVLRVQAEDNLIEVLRQFPDF